MPHKILILGKKPPPYMGTSVWFETLQQADWGEEWQVDFFDVNIHRSLETLGKSRLASIPKNLRLYRQLKKKLNATSYDLVLIPFSQETIGFLKDSVFIRIAARRVDKVLVMLHGSNFLNWQNNSPGWVKKYTRATLKKSNGVIVLGEKLRSLFINHYPPNTIHVVSNGADFHFPEIKRNDEERMNILYLSNLQNSKGIEDVIDAISLVRKEIKEIHLTVVGQWRDEATKDRCMRRVKEQQLPVTFTGPVYGNHKLEYFSKADVFVFPPLAPEGHPLVLVEAMAAGLPIISTDQGAITESVVDAENGFIVNPNSPEQIAEKLNLLLKNPDIRREMGQKSQKFYAELFTGEKMIKRFISVFETILNAK